MKIRSVAAYLFLVAVSVLFMLYLDGPGGSYLLTVLLLAALVSAGVCVYTKLAVSAELSVSEDILNKRDRLTVTLTVKKRGIIPTAVLQTEFFSSDHLEILSPAVVKGVCAGRNECAFQAVLGAKYFGKGKVGISSFFVTDYLGLMRFRVPVTRSVMDVRIYPDIPEVSRGDSFARSLADAAAFDDSEETTQSLFAFQGTPGYEHRLYEPGDSLKLINWKLSAKRDDLYVRRIEGSSGSEQVFILDKAGSSREGEQLAAEAMLGLIAQFAKSELPVKLIIRFTDMWEEIPVENMQDVAQLRHTMTDFSFLPDGVNRFPDSAAGGRVVIFSACAENGLAAYLDKLISEGRDCYAAAGEVAVFSEYIRRIERDNAVIRFVG